MGLFGKLIGTAIETVKLPVAVAKDVVTLGNSYEPDEKTHTEQQLDAIKAEAQAPDDGD